MYMYNVDSTIPSYHQAQVEHEELDVVKLEDVSKIDKRDLQQMSPVQQSLSRDGNVAL